MVQTKPYMGGGYIHRWPQVTARVELELGIGPRPVLPAIRRNPQSAVAVGQDPYAQWNPCDDIIAGQGMCAVVAIADQEDQPVSTARLLPGLENIARASASRGFHRLDKQLALQHQRSSGTHGQTRVSLCRQEPGESGYG